MHCEVEVVQQVEESRPGLGGKSKHQWELVHELPPPPPKTLQTAQKVDLEAESLPLSTT
jgi:hypothetical protein